MNALRAPIREDALRADSPLKTSYSRREAVAFAHEWIRRHHGGGKPTSEEYYKQLGLLFDFVTDMFPDNL